MSLSVSAEDAPVATPSTVIGPAHASDIDAILRLVAPQVEAEEALPRTPHAVARQLRDYVVARCGGRVVGAASVRLVDATTAEVGVLTAGTSTDEDGLLDAVLADAARLGAREAFIMTQRGERFAGLGFARTQTSAFPAKRDHDCLRCARAPRCRQQAWTRPLPSPEGGLRG